jgi:hypothetical protein
MRYPLRREEPNVGLPKINIRLWDYQTMFAQCTLLQVDFYSLTALWEGRYPDKSENTVP